MHSNKGENYFETYTRTTSIITRIVVENSVQFSPEFLIRTGSFFVFFLFRNYWGQFRHCKQNEALLAKICNILNYFSYFNQKLNKQV